MTKSIPLADKKITTAAHEDYLKAIYLLTAQGDEVSNTALTHYLAPLVAIRSLAGRVMTYSKLVAVMTRTCLHLALVTIQFTT